MDDRAKLIAGLPKAELHIHIEGSLEPEMMMALAARNGVRLPYATVDAVREAYRFTNLQDFLDLYYQGMSVLLREQDFFDLTMAYFRRAGAQGLRYAEIFFDPQGHTSRGVPFETVLNGLTRAQQAARAELGIDSQLIMCFLRHLDEADAERTVDQALAHRDKIVGVGLDSSEVGHPPSKFARVFRRARDAGFKLVAHAGEEGPPGYIWEAIDVLGVDRIDHGNRAIEDTELLRRIVRDKLALTMCPLSNLRLCVIKDLEDHPFQRMIDAGVRTTINSDDPAYFGGYIGDNFAALADALDLQSTQLQGVARTAFEVSFMPDDMKNAALRSFDYAVGQNNPSS